VLLDNAVAGSQPQAGAFAALLGGVKRLEDMRLNLGRNTHARIADRDQRVCSGAGPGVLARVRCVELDIGCGDRQRAAGGHGITGVDHQVDQHLFDLAWVGPDRP
jgi:hypothetical protein